MPGSPAARLADRVLCVAAGGVILASAALTWFGVARVRGPAAPAYWCLVAAVAGVGLAAAAFLVWRRRLYERLPAVKLMFALLALALPLAAVELTANLLDPGGYLYFAEAQRYFAGQRYDVLQDHAHPPNYRLSFPWGTVTTNAEGWRTPAVTEAKPEGTLRVLGLGDSVLFSWGVGDAQTLGRCLEARLTASLPADGPWKRVQVINTGNGSFSSLDELLTLRSRGLAYHPDLVFVLAIGNDFYDRPPWVDQVDWLELAGAHDPRTVPALRAAEAPRPQPAGPQGGLARTLFLKLSYLLNRSYLVVQGARVVGKLRAWWGGDPVDATTLPGSDQPPAPPASPAATPPGDAPSPSPAAPAPGGDPEPDALARRFPYLQPSTAALREVVATCRAEGIPVVVFAFADNLGSSGLCEHLQRELGADFEPLHYPGEGEVAKLVNSPTDPHWNPKGIQYFGGLMAPRLLAAVTAGGKPH